MEEQTEVGYTQNKYEEPFEIGRARQPYEIRLLKLVNPYCRDLLSFKWRTFANSDQGMMYGYPFLPDPDHDPWIICQREYLTVLLEDYRTRVPSIAEQMESEQKAWENNRETECLDVVAESGAYPFTFQVYAHREAR